MKQLLLRVPESLHERLATHAARDGRSINSLANEILDRHVADPTSEREEILARARLLDLLAPAPAVRPVSDEERLAALASTAGSGAVLDEILADGR